MKQEALERSAQQLLSSIVTGGGWLTSIESMMAHVDALGGGIARVTPPQMFAIPSSGVREQFIDMQAGRTPPLTKNVPLMPNMDDGFLADHMCSRKNVRRQTAFYQEFLRPRGCAHHVSAVLDATAVGTVNLLAFRAEKDGVFAEDEIAALNTVLPYLRSAAIVSRGALSWQGKRKAEPFERRGEPVIYLDIDGRVAEINPAAEETKGSLFNVVDRRLMTIVRADQAKLDRALKIALASAKPGLVTLNAMTTRGTTMALVLPLDGDARDVFQAVSALVIFIDQRQNNMPDNRTIQMLRDAAHLTVREADVVQLIAAGNTPREVGERLGIGFGTVRLHLKASFGKLGVRSQSELAELVKRLT